VEFLPTGITNNRRSSDIEIDQGKALFIHFRVTDTGCGFGSEEKLRIFERFEQASIRTHSKYGGSGLGLFISREMVESHGGEIGVYSQPGKGATFAFYIAAHAIELQTTAVSKTEELTLRPPKNSTPTTQHPSKYSILVVEDNLVNQKILRNQLQKLGHTVYVASDGAEALDFLSTSSLWAANASSSLDVSVILMDLEMPVMGGMECTRRIRQLQAQGELNRHVPIIAVSANARDAHVSEALGCGMDNAIAKPFRIADIMPKIEALVT
jgi:CheY-like chemotaxis protein